MMTVINILLLHASHQPPFQGEGLAKTNSF